MTAVPYPPSTWNDLPDHWQNDVAGTAREALQETDLRPQQSSVMATLTDGGRPVVGRFTSEQKTLTLKLTPPSTTHCYRECCTGTMAGPLKTANGSFALTTFVVIPWCRAPRWRATSADSACWSNSDVSVR